MNTVKIYRLDHLSHALFQRLKVAQMEAAQVWNLCMQTHQAARQSHSKWPGRKELQTARQVFKRFPSVKKQLWGGSFWSRSYYVGTVGDMTEAPIKKYIELGQG